MVPSTSRDSNGSAGGEAGAGADVGGAGEAHRHSASSTLSVLEEHEARICSFGAAFASLR